MNPELRMVYFRLGDGVTAFLHRDEPEGSAQSPLEGKLLTVYMTEEFFEQLKESLT